MKSQESQPLNSRKNSILTVLLAIAAIHVVAIEHVKGQMPADEQKVFSDESVSLYRSIGMRRTYSLTSADSRMGARMQIGQKEEPIVTIDINTKSSISAYYTASGVVLSFFEIKSDGDIILKWDLNADGIWDASLDKNTKVSSIIINGQWEKVSHLSSLFDKTPTASLGGKLFAFKDGNWVIVKEKP